MEKIRTSWEVSKVNNLQIFYRSNKRNLCYLMRFYHWSILSLSCTLSTQIGTARIAHKYRIKYCFAIKPHCKRLKSTSLEFTTLRMSIETGSLRFVKVRLYQRPLKYPGLLNFSFIYYNQSPIVTVIIIKV